MVNRLILIISLLLLVSCASRKVDVSKIAIETKVDSSVVVKVDGTYVKQANVATVETEEELEYKPIDSLKPMVIDGKSYTNTIIKSKKKKTVKIDKTKDIAKVSSVKKLNVKRAESKKVFVKKVDKKANYWMYLWFLLPVVLIWLLERYSKYLFPFLKFFK
jgi:uracil phosphoribosyltransferase